MRQFDVFDEQQRLEQRKEEKEQKVGFGVLALIVFIAGLAFIGTIGFYGSVCFALLSIVLGSIGINRNDTRGLSIASVIFAALYLLLTFGSCGTLLALSSL